MAELVSIRSSQSHAVEENNQANTNLSMTNPAYSNDREIDNGVLNHVTNGTSNGTNWQKLQGTTISFHNIKYTVDVKVNKKKTKKDIVKGIRYVR